MKTTTDDVAKNTLIEDAANSMKRLVDLSNEERELKVHVSELVVEAERRFPHDPDLKNFVKTVGTRGFWK